MTVSTSCWVNTVGTRLALFARIHYRTVLWMRQLVGVLGWQRHGLRRWFWQ